MREENSSSNAPPHSLPPVHLSESNDSKAQEELGFNESKQSLLSEPKDAVDDNAGLNAGHLPPSVSKSDSEAELPFKFPLAEGTSTEGTSMSPLYSPGPLQSSSSEETTPEVKQEPTSGLGVSDHDLNDAHYPHRDHDLNDSFDIRNMPLWTQGDVCLSSSASDDKISSVERSVITREDVEVIRAHASDWQTENDALMAMGH